MDLGNLLNGVKPEEGRGGALPAGNYNVMIEKVEGKDTAAGGKALSIQLRIFGEKYNNAVIFDFINLSHPTSQEAADIGKGRAARIAELVGNTNTDGWLNKAVTVYAGVQKQEGFEDRNTIGQYKAYDNAGQGTTPTGNQNTQGNSPAQTATDDIPW